MMEDFKKTAENLLFTLVQAQVEGSLVNLDSDGLYNEVDGIYADLAYDNELIPSIYIDLGINGTSDLVSVLERVMKREGLE